MRRMTMFVMGLLTLTALVTVSAQSPAARPNTPPATQQEQAPDGLSEYKVGRGDRIAVELTPDVDEIEKFSGSYIVGTDGSIKFPRLGLTKVDGLAERSIEELLVKQLMDKQLFSRPPTIRVAVVDFRSQIVYVMGAVRSSGSQTIKADKMTLNEAISAAGNYDPTAGPEVIIFHPLKPDMGPVTNPNDPNITVTRRNRKEILETGENPRLFDGDTIYVPVAEMFYINGEVRSGGAKVWSPGITIGEALAAAGGMTEKGTLGRSKIRRYDPAKKKFVDVKKLKPETIILAKDELIIGKKLL